LLYTVSNFSEDSLKERISVGQSTWLDTFSFFTLYEALFNLTRAARIAADMNLTPRSLRINYVIWTMKNGICKKRTMNF
jgi:hypothetical protein